ncbi:hypothetical protein MRX96_026313 [Rhipicephalus microplus]
MGETDACLTGHCKKRGADTRASFELKEALHIFLVVRSSAAPVYGKPVAHKNAESTRSSFPTSECCCSVLPILLKMLSWRDAHSGFAARSTRALAATVVARRRLSSRDKRPLCSLGGVRFGGAKRSQDKPGRAKSRELEPRPPDNNGKGADRSVCGRPPPSLTVIRAVPERWKESQMYAA